MKWYFLIKANLNTLVKFCLIAWIGAYDSGISNQPKEVSPGDRIPASCLGEAAQNHHKPNIKHLPKLYLCKNQFGCFLCQCLEATHSLARGLFPHFGILQCCSVLSSFPAQLLATAGWEHAGANVTGRWDMFGCVHRAAWACPVQNPPLLTFVEIR